MVRVPVLSVQITDVAPPVSVPADKRLDGMLDACDLVLAFTKTSSHQEAVHILAGKILVVEINVHIRPVAEESVFTGSRHQNGLPESSNLISLKGEFASETASEKFIRGRTL